MPASNARALQKAPSLACDCVIADLEDAIAGGSRRNAHDNLLALFHGRDFGTKERIIRLSQFGGDTFSDDFSLALKCSPDAILLAKVEEAITVSKVAARLEQAGSSARLWAMIETPLGILNLKEIAAVSKRLQCLVVGPNDLAKNTGIKLEPGRDVLRPWLMMVIAAARAYRLNVLDGVFNRFQDTEGFATECAEGAAMGFDGKTLIHPSQIELANSAFGPSGDELSRALEIIAAFERPENRSKGVISIDGEMMERLHYEMAIRLRQLSDLS